MAVTVSMLEFRRNAQAVLRRLQSGQRFVLTHRGRAVACLEPLPSRPAGTDPIFALEGIVEEGGATLSNREIDALVYGR